MVRGPLLEACFVHLSLLYNLVFCIYKDNSELRPGNGNHRLFGIWWVGLNNVFRKGICGVTWNSFLLKKEKRAFPMCSWRAMENWPLAGSRSEHPVVFVGGVGSRLPDGPPWGPSSLQLASLGSSKLFHKESHRCSSAYADCISFWDGECLENSLLMLTVSEMGIERAKDCNALICLWLFGCLLPFKRSWTMLLYVE